MLFVRAGTNTLEKTKGSLPITTDSTPVLGNEEISDSLQNITPSGESAVSPLSKEAGDVSL